MKDSKQFINLIDFAQLLLLCANDDSKIHEYLAKKTDKYNSPQNQLLQIMANSIVHKIAAAIKATRYCTLMANEVTDSLNREQVVICLHWIDNKFDADEDFVLGSCISSSFEGCFVEIKFISC